MLDVIEVILGREKRSLLQLDLRSGNPETVGESVRCGNYVHHHIVVILAKAWKECKLTTLI